MVDWLGSALGWLGGVLLGFLAGLLTSFLTPLQGLVAKLGRSVWDPRPLDVNVETDLAVIWAGYPDWMGASFWVPGPNPPSPPVSLGEWQQWVESLGGCDSGTSTIRLTLVARGSVTVVVGMPQVQATCETLPPGVTLLRPTGGASIQPLGIDVRLDAGQSWASVSGPDGSEPQSALSWSMRPGDVHQFLIRVSPGFAGLWKWQLELPLIVDGESRSHSVTNDGKSFVVVGHEDVADELLWVGDQWVPRAAV